LPEGQWLVAALSGGRAALFYSLVLLHAATALVGFGSIGFAGTYASRAYLPPEPHLPPEDADHCALEPGSARPPGTEVTGQAVTGQAVSGQAVSGQAVSGQAVSGQAVTGRAVTGQDAETEELLRYFERPARLWLALVAVPFLGFGALASDPSLGGLDQAWALAAILVWLAATLIAGSLVVPALRQMRSMLFQPADPDQPTRREAERVRFARTATLAGRGAACCDVLFFVALALMIWRP
jgi:hypothetical protein